MILISHYQHIRNIGVISMFLLINVGSLMNVKEQVHSRFTASLPVYCTNALENCDLDLHYNLDLTFPLCSSLFQRNSSTYFIHISHEDKYNVLGLCLSLLTLSFCVTLNFYYFPICFHFSLQHCELRSVKIQNTFFHVVIGMIISYGHTSMGLYNLR